MKNNWKFRTFFAMLGLLTTALGYYLRSKDSYYHYLLLYVGGVIAIWQLPDWKPFRILKSIVSIPAGILMIVGPLMKIYLLYFLGYIGPFVVIAMVIKFMPLYLFNLDLSYASKVYITISLSLLFITFFSEKIIAFLNYNLNADKPESYITNYRDLTFHMMNRHRTRFLIFFFFFCYIIIFTVASLNEVDLFVAKNTNVAIMQSFATYIAFDRIMSNKDLLNFRPKDFLRKIARIWNYDFVNPENNNYEKDSITTEEVQK